MHVLRAKPFVCGILLLFLATLGIPLARTYRQVIALPTVLDPISFSKTLTTTDKQPVRLASMCWSAYIFSGDCRSGGYVSPLFPSLPGGLSVFLARPLLKVQVTPDDPQIERRAILIDTFWNIFWIETHDERTRLFGPYRSLADW